MSAPQTALLLFGVYFGIAFVLRSLLQWRRTGDTGFRGLSGRVGSGEWWASVLFVVALATGFLGPVTALYGLEPVAALDADPVQATGAALALLGIVGTFATQLQMGASWRIGVDEEERTALVTRGIFSVVRNPIFSAMIVTALGLALIVPNAVSLVGLALLVLAIQLQVRVVEEPYLLSSHGDDYAAYAASVGRFVPALGRLVTER